MKKDKVLVVLFCLLAFSLIVDLQHVAAFSGAVGVRLVVRGTDNGVYSRVGPVHGAFGLPWLAQPCRSCSCPDSPTSAVCSLS